MCNTQCIFNNKHAVLQIKKNHFNSGTKFLKRWAREKLGVRKSVHFHPGFSWMQVGPPSFHLSHDQIIGHHHGD